MCSHPELRQNDIICEAPHSALIAKSTLTGTMMARLPFHRHSTDTEWPGSSPSFDSGECACTHDALREVVETTSATAKDAQSIRVTCFGPRRHFFSTFLTVLLEGTDSRSFAGIGGKLYNGSRSTDSPAPSSLSI